MNKSSLSFLIALMAASFSLPTIAQEQQQSRQLMGGVQMHVDPSMRIDRNRLRSGVMSNDFAGGGSLIPQEPAMAPIIDSKSFQGNVNAYKAAPILQTIATKSDTNKVPPYIWYQSALGGYYDASGTTKEVVRAERLHQFGGKFQDGTLVPRNPIPMSDINAMGHAFRGSTTPTSHFWTR
jgi:hypothetical protein